MHTFLAVMGADGASRIPRILGHVSTAGLSMVPTIEGPLTSRIEHRPDSDFGWMVIEPKQSTTRSPIHARCSKHLDVFVLGFISGSADPADTVSSAFRSGGVDGIKALTGSFGAAIFNHNDRRGIFVSDPIGHQAFRWVERDGLLYVASHDVPLVLAGATPVDPDPVSIVSTLSFEWSLSGTPLLRGVRLVDPLGRLEWSPYGVKTHSDTSWFEKPKVALQDKKAVKRCIDETLVSLREAGTNIVRENQKLTISLTGGVDSRLVLSLLPNLPEIPHLIAATSGGADSMDVVWAKRLARIVGIPHQISEVSSVSEEQFLRHLDLLSFAMNGDTNGCWAISSLRATPDGETRLTGGGGEIYRGYYYALLKGRTQGATSGEGVTGRLLKKGLNRLSLLSPNLDLIDGAYIDGLKTRLGDMFQRYNTVSSDAYDQLDLFYLLERFGRWGALSSRRSWYNISTPLSSQAAVRAFYHIPREYRPSAPIHRHAICRYLPLAAAVMPINGWRPLFLGEETRAAKALGAIYKKTESGRHLISRALRGESLSASEQVRSRVMAGPILSLIRDTLLGSTGLMTTVVPFNEVVHILNKFEFNQDPTLMQIIGFMTTIENWHRQVIDAERRAYRD